MLSPARASEKLEANPDKADEAVVATDSYITLPPDPRRDAIILDIRGYRERAFQIRMGPSQTARISYP